MTLEQTKTSYYRVGGNLPPDAPSYVRREADEQLYQKLKSGEFCYVLNSRQMGKSSLWVRVKQRLEQEDYVCAAVDLSGIGQGEKQQWYASFANRLTKSFDPSVKKQWRSWRKEAEHLELSPMEKLHQLIEELLLPSLLPHQKLVIFIDEIDYVKGLSFSTDEFFALIRSCYNDRSLNPQFNRVTFCLLGVATPADLIANKQLTPFNIGTGIELRGFRLGEAEPLIAGLAGKVTSPESVMSEILYWTGGQPFLTQRLCNLVLAENNPTPDISKLVHRLIIDHWETQDEQEHLRTIQNRILSNEQRAGYLLELYRQVLEQGQVPLNNSSEERELRLSGLIVKRNNALEVYNPIYARVFNEAWLDLELAKLRPYAENYRTWMRSGKTDVSRLLRGQALKDAEAWALGKNLGGEDQDFLGASRAKEREAEIANKEKEAELERERKAREAAEKAERIQAEANQKAHGTIRRGRIILGVTLLGAIISTGFGLWQYQKTQTQLKQVEEALSAVRGLSELAGKLREKWRIEASDEALRKAGLSTLIDNEELKQAWLLAATAEADPSEGKDELEQAVNILKDLSPNSQNQVENRSDQLNQVKAFTYLQAGELNDGNSDSPEDFQDKINYKQAYDALKASNFDPYPLNGETDVENETNTFLTEQDVENIHYRLIESRDIDINSSDEIAISFRKHLYDGLEFLLQENYLSEADSKTWDIMLYLADQKDGYFAIESLERVSCPALREIDKRWLNYSEKPGYFGFSVQKETWQKVGSPNWVSPKDWRKFYNKDGRELYNNEGWEKFYRESDGYRYPIMPQSFYQRRMEGLFYSILALCL